MEIWNVAKTKPHDASDISNPERWMWQLYNGVYYPAYEIDEDDTDEKIPEENVTGNETAIF